MRFNLIGSFEIVDDHGAIHSPGTPKVCQTLAVLLTRPGKIAGFDTLIQELWGDRPPRTAATALQTYIYYARKMLVEKGLATADRSPLTTHPQGYMFEVDEDRIDVKVFERLVAQGRSELDRGNAEEAIGLLCSALDLWRGPALASIRAGRVLRGRITHLEELRIRAHELRIEALIHLGRHREAIPELGELVTLHPLNEWFHGHLIDALYQAGRRAEALQAYQGLRRILREELGVDPSSEVQDLYQRLLNTDPPRVLTDHMRVPRAAVPPGTKAVCRPPSPAGVAPPARRRPVKVPNAAAAY
ncbi:AfsR/SARP family transcriptional regulator [Streptomyces sp. 21So2-11]|uniref:AfsR/SARP family transcriptional regulator n=1 Tax=Streptomyces sp. 21So2-11 TaxID=3144408 RepID=UPI00321993FE